MHWPFFAGYLCWRLHYPSTLHRCQRHGRARGATVSSSWPVLEGCLAWRKIYHGSSTSLGLYREDWGGFPSPPPSSRELVFVNLLLLHAMCSSVAGRRYKQMQNQVEQMQEELYRSEIGNYIWSVNSLITGWPLVWNRANVRDFGKIGELLGKNLVGENLSKLP